MPEDSESIGAQLINLLPLLHNRCLHGNVTRGNCPICQTAYRSSDIRMLQLDVASNFDRNNQEIDLLQRLAVSWDAPDQIICRLMDRVEDWLADCAPDSYIPLRKALELVQRVRRRKEVIRSQKSKIQALEQECERLENDIQRMTDNYGGANRRSQNNNWMLTRFATSLALVSVLLADKFSLFNTHSSREISVVQRDTLRIGGPFQGVPRPSFPPFEPPFGMPPQLRPPDAFGYYGWQYQ